jgi:FHA domain/von Willebrand factor type A domain
VRGLSVTISFIRASMKGFLFSLILLLPLSCFADTQAVSVLIDTSKSIPLTEFAKTKKTVQELKAKALPNDTINIYAFGNNLRKLDDKQLSSLEPTDSYTYLYDAIYDSARELDKIPADRKALVLITDGIDTSSATTIEDAMNFSNSHGIAIHAIGTGKVDHKSLQRMSKLTNGTVLQLKSPKLASDIQGTVASQKAITAAPVMPTPTPSPTPAPVVPKEPAPSTTEKPSEPVTQPEPEPIRPSGLMAHYGYLLWIVGAGIIAVPVVLWLVTRAFKKETRPCPGCGKPLEEFQTFCPDCAAVPKTIIAPASSIPLRPDSTQEIKRHLAPEPFDPPSLPPEVLIKQSDADEVLSKTFVLMDKPLLVVRKGKNIGQTFTLNRSVPISIGRSRVCEIKLEDTTVSGQHCRIIPENGKHFLYDLRSTNGTFVNEKKVRKVELKEGDVIKVGETHFLYKVEQQRN